MTTLSRVLVAGERLPSFLPSRRDRGVAAVAMTLLRDYQMGGLRTGGPPPRKSSRLCRWLSASGWLGGPRYRRDVFGPGLVGSRAYP